jgi:tRNA A-37 threonylcarbamoyl transferase component Bud32
MSEIRVVAVRSVLKKIEVYSKIEDRAVDIHLFKQALNLITMLIKYLSD